MQNIGDEIIVEYKSRMHNVGLLVKFINQALIGGLKVGKSVCGFSLIVRNKNKTVIGMFGGLPIFSIEDGEVTVHKFSESVFKSEPYKLVFINKIFNK